MHAPAFTRQQSLGVISRMVSPAHSRRTSFLLSTSRLCTTWLQWYITPCEARGTDKITSRFSSTMVRLQANDRYYSRRGLLRFLQATFPNCKNFRISEVKDGFFTFEAPRELTDVSGLPTHQASKVPLTPAGRVDVSRHN
ncbi:hypothetical protein BU25DRAFT_241725 [Macroventuria anomochaeta]|uniref:Uncharacterized protein n=1 Tax=Macroventuria anomochaeta TaxID=301207 RepID=A0ACB6RH17_9PLEO|nr:uncharacterized protein BU25DRAFT_241725 [Macroventuria anomochaeta]KAF2621210.1 hypothetical protein BU25DRAFT_241725 [Macroventuria anomochaeta]